jgi:hypothetical protein
MVESSTQGKPPGTFLPGLWRRRRGLHVGEDEKDVVVCGDGYVCAEYAVNCFSNEYD